METTDMEALKEQLLQMATITSWLDDRSEKAAKRVETSADVLEQGARQLDGSSERFVEEVTRLIGEQVHQAVIQGASKAVGEFDTQLLASARAAQWAAQVMEEQRKGLSAVQHALIWKGLLALFIGALLAIGGAGFVAWDSMRAIRTAHFEQDVLQAVQSGAITKCGDALCAKVGKQSRRYGSNGDYVLLSQ